MIKKLGRNILCIAFAVLFLPVFFSCSGSSERKSISSALEQIDILINQEQYKDAERELKKIEKKSYSSWIEIGIFKRYIKIGLKEKAEKVLIKALEKNPENEELNAVYSNFLLRNKRTSEALLIGKKLQGTKYGSIYSEAVFRETIERAEKNELEKIFLNEEYFPIYYDVYTGTNELYWLRNCALLRLKNGAYENAAAIQPGTAKILEAENGYFWANVMYDAGRFTEAINYAEKSVKLLKFLSGRKKEKVSFFSLTSILQDSYIQLGEADEAENIRKEYIDSLIKNDGKIVLANDSSIENNDFLPAIFVNSAKWSEDSDDKEREYFLLTFCAETWPDYVPGLLAYADFAWKSNLPPDESFVQMELRDKGLLTLEMERYDKRPKIPLSDALYKIDESLKRKKDPYLFIAQKDYKYKTDKTITVLQKVADIWKTLEQNSIAPSVYEPVLFDYAMSFLLKENRTEEAWNLFYKYICAKYKISEESDFWSSIVQKVSGFTTKESEYAFYFAIQFKKSAESLRLGEYCVFENQSAQNSDKKYISTAVSDESIMNLSMVYNALGKTNESLDLYKRLNGRISERKIKSNAMYKMAEIYFDLSDYKNAKICAEYSVTLDIQNVQAKLLLEKIKTKK